MTDLTKYRCRDCGTIVAKPDKGPVALEICDSTDRVVECRKVGEWPNENAATATDPES